MYAIGTKVYVKSVGRVGRVSDRARSGSHGRVSYVVRWVDLGGGGDYMTASRDLRNAEGGCCDGCGRWLPPSSYLGGATGPDGEYPHGLKFCFLCVRESEEQSHRLELAEILAESARERDAVRRERRSASRGYDERAS